MKWLFSIVLLVCCPLHIQANYTTTRNYDFVKDGIYYRVLSPTTVAVTPKKYEYVTYTPSDEPKYIGKYIFESGHSGAVIIPETVTYNGNTYTVTAVDEYAFVTGMNGVEVDDPIYSSEVTSVTVPGTIKTVDDTFHYCSQLRWVVLKEGIERLEGYMFYECPLLEEIYIPSTVTYIGTPYTAYQRFVGNCPTLSKIHVEWTTPLTLPNGAFMDQDITKVSLYVPYGCKAAYAAANYWKNFKEIKEIEPEELHDGDTFTAQTIEGATLTYYVLSTIEKTVRVREGANVSKVTIPETVNGFTVVSIGTEAFENCTNLTEVDIPSTVTEIKSDAFGKCGFTSFVLPKTVTSISGSILYGCSNLTSVSVENGNTVYDSRENCNGIIETATNTLVLGYERTVIPTNVTTIGEDAFHFSTATDYEIPSHIVTIGDYAFYKCNLTSVIIPASVTSIGEGAFDGCQSLTTVISKITNPFAIDNYAFYYAYNTATLYVPVGTKSKYQAISGWNRFNNIVETIQTVEGVNMTVVVTSENDKTCQVGVGQYAVPAISQSTEGVVTIPSEGNGYTVTKIGVSAFQSCKKITEVNIPNTVTSIGNHAFDQCAALESVNIPNSVTTIGDGAFMECAKLASIEFPNSLERLENYAFGDCPSLTSVVIPNSVTFMDMPFADCTGLISIFSEIEEPFDMNVISFTYYDETTSTRYPLTATLYVPIGTKSLYQAATGWNVLTMKNIGEEDPAVFVAESANGVEMLFKVTDEENKKCQIGTGAGTAVWKNTTGSVVLPMTVNGYTVTAIADNAFAGTGISSVVIPSSIVNIGENAFKECPNLANVKSYIEEPYSIPASAFSGISDEATISILYGTKDTYLAASGWNAFASVIDNMAIVDGIVYHVEQSEESIALVEKNTYWATYEGEMIIPEQFTINSSTFNVKGIGEAAFQNSLITSVSIPETVLSIGSLAFSNCTQLLAVKSYITEPWDFNEQFSNLPADATLYVPYGLKNAYENISTWNAFASIEEIKEIEPTDISSLTDAIYANPVTVSKGSTATLTISLKNAQTTNGYSFDLKLPEGVTLAKDNSDEYLYTLSTRHNGHVATVNYKEASGVYGFAVMSLSSKDVKESDGAILTLTLNISDEMKEGDYAVKVQNARYSLSSGATSVAMEEVTSLLTVDSYIKGDANGDSMVDIADAVCIVNHIVGKATPAFIEAAADANGDGVVDIADAVRIVNLIVGKIDALAREQNMDDALPNPE